MFANQVFPEHRHPPIGDDPGKEERKTIQDYCKLAGVKC
jgi:hypothetical protein